MPPATVIGLAHHLSTGHFDTVIEWGSGGSTILAVALGIPQIISVETDPSWSARVRGIAADSFPEDSLNLDLRGFDCGPVGPWGYPRDQLSAERVRDYVNEGLQHASRERTLYLVDGRYRLACMTSILSILEPTSIAILDDYRPRPAYWLLDKYQIPDGFLGHAAVYEASERSPATQPSLDAEWWMNPA